MRKFIVDLAIFAGAILILNGCTSGPLRPEPSVEAYTIRGTAVNFISTDSTRIDLALTKNGVAYKKATIRFAGISLDTITAGYTKKFSRAQIHRGTSYTLNIKDSTTLDMNLTITIPDSLEITPRARNFIGLAEPVEWSVSALADGYILATIPPSAYPLVIDSGYEEYYTPPDGSIPPEAFSLSTNLPDTRMEGYHYIIVAAYDGAPIKTAAFSFGVPSINNPVDNVAVANMTGRLCGMVVARPDSIFVPTQ